MSRTDNITRIINSLIQIGGWSFFILAPVISNQERFFSHPMMLTEFLLRQLVLVIFFYVNYFYLIPHILRLKGLKKYLFSVIMIFAVVFAIQNLIENAIRPHFRISFISIVGMVQIYAISTTLRMLIDSIAETQRKRTLEKEKQQAELAYLRSQINPHFLFNTLNNINSLIRKNPEAAEQTVIKLSNLMRYVMHSSKLSKIALKDEINYLNNFIGLQRIRLPAQFDLKYEVINGESEKEIEPLLLIGFIENPFKHALSGEESDFIHIRINLQEEILTLEIENSIHKSKNPLVESGVGIENIRRRLQLSYPGKHELVIREEPNIFHVFLKIHL